MSRFPYGCYFMILPLEHVPTQSGSWPSSLLVISGAHDGNRNQPVEVGGGSAPLVLLVLKHSRRKLEARAKTHAVMTYYSLKSKIKRDFGEKPLMMSLRVLNISLSSLENEPVNKLRS